MYSNGHTYYVTLLGVIGTDIKFKLAKAEIVYVYARLFFSTPPAKKTKTQGQNSSKKLKKKSQPLVGLSLQYAKLN